MNWYITHKHASARDEKVIQVDHLRANISDVINQAMIGGDEVIKILDGLIKQLEGGGGYRNLIPSNISNAVLKLLVEAKKVKKDSPHQCCALLEEALSYLY